MSSCSCCSCASPLPFVLAVLALLASVADHSDGGPVLWTADSNHLAGPCACLHVPPSIPECVLDRGCVDWRVVPHTFQTYEPMLAAHVECMRWWLPSAPDAAQKTGRTASLSALPLQVLKVLVYLQEVAELEVASSPAGKLACGAKLSRGRSLNRCQRL